MGGIAGTVKSAAVVGAGVAIAAVVAVAVFVGPSDISNVPCIINPGPNQQAGWCTGTFTTVNPSPSPSPVPSPTPSPTVAPSGLVFDFEDGATEGWSAAYGSISVSNTTAQAFSGTHSLAIASTGGYQAVAASVSGLMGGTQVIYHVWAPQNVTVVPFVTDSGFHNTFAASVTVHSGWNTVTWTAPNVAIAKIGLQVNQFSGTTYLDAVGWPGPTPSPSPSPVPTPSVSPSPSPSPSAGPSPSPTASPSPGGLDHRVFGTNMGLFTGNEPLLSSAGAQAILTGWHTPVIRMPFRQSLTDAVELQALQAIKIIGATPLVIVHGAADSTVATDDPHLLALVAQVFGSSTVYVEYGNEEDLAGINDAAYTTSWNSVVPGLKSAHPTYQFIGPVNFQADPSYIAYFVQNAVPEPDVVSWHEYAGGPSDSTSTFFSHIADWTSHVNNTNAAEITAVGHTFPFMISEWNMDYATGDARYSDPTVIGPWTTMALQELSSLVPSGLIGAQQYCADDHQDFALFNGTALTPQGVAFQSVM